jgi:hypothetical protein
VPVDGLGDVGDLSASPHPPSSALNVKTSLRSLHVLVWYTFTIPVTCRFSVHPRLPVVPPGHRESSAPQAVPLPLPTAPGRPPGQPPA